MTSVTFLRSRLSRLARSHRISLNRIGALLLLPILALSPSTQAATLPFTINLDTNLSVAHISIDVLGKNDTQTAKLAGSFVAGIDALPTPTMAGVGDFRMATIGTVNFKINLDFAGLATATSPKFVVKAHLPQTIPALFPLSAGDFVIPTVPYDTEGSASYKVSGLTCTILSGSGRKCSDTIDLSKAPPGAMQDLNGHVDVTDKTMRVELTGFFSLLLDPTNPDLGVLSGTIDAVGTVDLPPPASPVRLEISRVPADKLRIRWPKSATGAVLFQSDTLGKTAVWTPSPGAPTPTDTSLDYTTSPTSKSRYYRLQ